MEPGRANRQPGGKKEGTIAKDKGMKRRSILAILLVLGLGTVQGCAPGDFKDYTAKAQQAGEMIFEGKSVPAGVAAGELSQGPETMLQEETEEETETMPKDTSAKEAPAGTGQETAKDLNLDAAALPLPEKGEETGSGQEDGVSMGEMGIRIRPRAQETETTKAAGREEERPEEGSAGMDPGEGETAERENAEAVSLKEAGDRTHKPGLAAMAGQLPEEVCSAMDLRAKSFTGHLSGRDSFGKGEQEALQAVLQKRPYDEKTLCLANTVEAAGKDAGVFLLLFDREGLAVRGKVQGDLWFWAGKEAQLLSQGQPFGKVCGIQTGGEAFLLAETGNGKTAKAQVYRAGEECAGPCFAGAKSITQTADGLCVTYASHFVEYEPADGSWSGEGLLSYFYRWEKDAFVQQAVRPLTVEQYLSYIQPDTETAADLLWKEGQEEKFYGPQAEREKLRYCFFAVGDNRVGYRECRIGTPSRAEEDAFGEASNAERERNVTAAYRYRITELENGVLSPSCKTYDGAGYYFADYDGRKEELYMSTVPAAYGKNRLADLQDSLAPKGHAALERVLEVQPYMPEDICFVRTADYDGDGTTESFVAAGAYDRFLGTPVCDLWFSSEKGTVLLAEGLPVKDCRILQDGENCWFLLSGCGGDRLYGATDGMAARYLENAFAIAAGENGGLEARLMADGGARLYYYHFREGTMEEYGLQEKPVGMLLDFGNGRAVYRRLQKLSETLGAGLSCLEQENGLLHVKIAGRDGRTDYETYRVQDGMLVLWDSGEWTEDNGPGNEGVGQNTRVGADGAAQEPGRP